MSAVTGRSGWYPYLSLSSTADLRGGQANDPKIGVCFMAHNSAKSGLSAIFSHHRNTLIQPRRMVYW